MTLNVTEFTFLLTVHPMAPFAPELEMKKDTGDTQTMIQRNTPILILIREKQLRLLHKQPKRRNLLVIGKTRLNSLDMGWTNVHPDF